MKTLTILGTTRDDSNTMNALSQWPTFVGSKLVILHELNINHFVYDHDSKPDDDFLSVANLMVEADHIVFATPVYWYAMSGPMKVFFDRFSDLISTSKLLGRSLSGKTTELFATGSDSDLPDGFEVPFARTSKYFAMEYKGATYVRVNP